MNEKPPSYEQAVLESKKYVKPVLVQPNAGRYVHKIPEEIQPGIPSRQFIIMEKCPACGVSYFYLVSEALKFRRFPVNAQWSDRVTKPLRSFSDIETFLDFLNAFVCIKII